jgi:chaperone required for assembly of F1-ATPase
MTEWKARRFWKNVSVAPCDSGYTVLLDDRPIRTPARRPVTAPTQVLAQALAAEWDAQGEHLDPAAMPHTRMTNSAIDTVAYNRAAVIDTIAAYGDTDLVCYRASHPAGLVARQAAEWDPLLLWARHSLGARLVTVQGVMHMPQPKDALAALRTRLEQADDFALAALHELVALSGSLVIGLRAAADGADIDALWQASCLDERWQREQWGADDEAEALSASRREAFLKAAEYLEFARP